MEEELYKCECCNKPVYKKYGSGRFCSKTCASIRKHPPEQRKKVSETLKLRNSYGKSLRIKEYNKNPNFCKNCGTPLSYEKRDNSTCCPECYKSFIKECGRMGGITSAHSQKRRSKNEIYFYDLCKEKFKQVLHNEPIFNNWDADIIIEDYKIAVLWNGIWHYKQISKSQSLAQVQSRDKIKITQIIDCKYIPYIIKDLGKYDKKFVEQEFNKFMEYVSNNINTPAN